MDQRHQIFHSILLILVAAFLILTALVKTNPYLSFDLDVTRAVQSFNPVWFDLLMKFISWLGQQTLQILLPVMAALGLIIGHKKAEGVTLLLSTSGAIAISETFKRIVARPRPDSNLITQVGQYLKPDSFPSGHVLFFIGFFGFLLYLSFARLEKNWLKKILVSLFFLLIGLIGVSRIYLGAHWFSDVLGSYLIGGVWLLLVVHLYPAINRKLST